MRTNMKRSNGMADQKSHKLRMDGMAMALRIVEEYGVEGLREEVKTRKAMFHSTRGNQKIRGRSE